MDLETMNKVIRIIVNGYLKNIRTIVQFLNNHSGGNMDKSSTSQKKLRATYFSEEEDRFIIEAAKKYGMSISEVIRRLCFYHAEQNRSCFERLNHGWSVR